MSGLEGAGRKRRDQPVGDPDLNSSDEDLVGWLIDGDPSVAWQAQRDLVGSPEDVWRATRDAISLTGWGRRLLEHQDHSGRWGGGLYTPKWTSTTYTLLLLRSFGLNPSHPAAVKGTHQLLNGATWVERGVAYRGSGLNLPERCVNGMVLSIVSYFDVDDPRIDGVAEALIAGRVADGGWNCRDHRGDTHHSSLNTTISVLEGLDLWRRRRGSTVADDAILGGQEVLLDHRLFRSHRTGRVISSLWTRFSFPPRWRYDILRGLDHLRESGAKPDRRAAEAIGLVEASRGPKGWSVGPRHPGQEFFRLEDGRYPGRWNTLRALRVLGWWGGA